jgi:hypothetical protein
MSHPYTAYEGTATWKLIDQAIGELVANRDLIEQTQHAYIVGYLCKTLSTDALNANQA